MTNKKLTTYKNLVEHYNRDVSPYITCECGKIITEKLYQRHKTTKLHNYLMEYKKQCEELKNIIKEEMLKEQNITIDTSV